MLSCNSELIKVKNDAPKYSKIIIMKAIREKCGNNKLPIITEAKYINNNKGANCRKVVTLDNFLFTDGLNKPYWKYIQELEVRVLRAK